MASRNTTGTSARQGGSVFTAMRSVPVGLNLKSRQERGDKRAEEISPGFLVTSVIALSNNEHFDRYSEREFVCGLDSD